MAGSFASVMYWAVRTTLKCLAVGGRAIAIPGSDATGQDALDVAAEDLRRISGPMPNIFSFLNIFDHIDSHSKLLLDNPPHLVGWPVG